MTKRKLKSRPRCPLCKGSLTKYEFVSHDERYTALKCVMCAREYNLQHQEITKVDVEVNNLLEYKYNPNAEDEHDGIVSKGGRLVWLSES